MVGNVRVCCLTEGIVGGFPVRLQLREEMAPIKCQLKCMAAVVAAVLVVLFVWCTFLDKDRRAIRFVSVPSIGIVQQSLHGAETRGADHGDQISPLESPKKQQSETVLESADSNVDRSSVALVTNATDRHNTLFKFNTSGYDVMVFLHMQKTSGTMFGLHLVDIDATPSCHCSVVGYQTWLGEGPRNKTLPSLVGKCTCPRTPTSSKPEEQWLFSRYTFGWPCGVHADWTLLKECVPSLYKHTAKQSVLHYVTVLRHPVDRFLSEYEHVLHGAVWKESRTILSCKDKLFYLTECYSKYRTNGSFSLRQFMDCPYNAAKNRQTFMLADWNLIPCEDVLSHAAKERILLQSAIKNLGQMAYFALAERQNESMILFERSFDLHFKHPFQQRSRVQSNRYTSEQLRQVEAENRLDMQLYNHATKLFNERLL